MRRWLSLPAIVALAACVPWTVRPIGKEADAAVVSPAAYVDAIWTAKLVPAVLAAAVDVRTLLDAPPARGPACFMVKGRGVVVSVDTSSRHGVAMVDVAPFDGRPDVSIQIGPVIRGNSLRDATGVVRFSDFVNQLQFADVGNELNERVLKTVLTGLDRPGLKGRVVTFAGTLAAELPLRELVPVKLDVEERR